MARRRRPRDPQLLMLWPGAGTGADHESLLAIDDGIAEIPVRRVDFPYRREGRKAPDRAPKLIASINTEVAAAADELDMDPARIVIGGRSMGGRMCSMAAAEGLTVAGVVLIAYPLHPPGNPEKLRTEHLSDLRVPSLWLCGDRDPFGTPDELSLALESVAGAVTSVTLQGRHDLKSAGDATLAEIRDWLGLPRRAAR
ncbi:MAG: alpha/beta hydrolase family protein [Microthrixaceae bacterium]